MTRAASHVKVARGSIKTEVASLFCPDMASIQETFAGTHFERHATRPRMGLVLTITPEGALKWTAKIHASV